MPKGNYTAELQSLGFSLNEARLYETLLRQGAISVAALAKIIGIGQRNAYDSQLRLLEKGLVLEIVQVRENVYQAIDPHKLDQLVDEEQAELASAMPELQALCRRPAAEEHVKVFRGSDGWRNHLREVVRIGSSLYILGGKPFWEDLAVARILPWFKHQLAAQKQEAHLLLDSSLLKAKSIVPPDPFKRHYRFLSPKYSSTSMVHTCGDWTTFIAYTSKKQGTAPLLPPCAARRWRRAFAVGLGLFGILCERSMHTELLQKLGLARNEARIYEALLCFGESSIGRIAAKSGVHRRNVYDLLPLLVEKGLIFEIPTSAAANYSAAPPDALLSLIESKRARVASIIPDLGALFKSHALDHEVYVYRGPEGWKNYMRDHLRIGDVAYYISAKGAWLDHRVRHFFPLFEREARQRRFRYYHLFDQRVEHGCPEVLPYVGPHYKFLPADYSGPSSIDIFGDHVNLLSDISIGRMGDEIRFTVIVNQAIADSFRTWFQLLWDILPPRKGRRNEKSER